MDLGFNIGAEQWPGDDPRRDLEFLLAEDAPSPLGMTMREPHIVGGTGDICDGLACETMPAPREREMDEVNSAIEAIRG
ncbi:MAG: hypothetical protein AAB393_18900, partial [Bacteroidota bacterium]